MASKAAPNSELEVLLARAAVQSLAVSSALVPAQVPPSTSASAGEDSVLRAAIKQTLANGGCTFACTGSRPFAQPVLQCSSCRLAAVCLSCASACHKGHALASVAPRGTAAPSSKLVIVPAVCSCATMGCCSLVDKSALTRTSNGGSSAQASGQGQGQGLGDGDSVGATVAHLLRLALGKLPQELVTKALSSGALLLPSSSSSTTGIPGGAVGGTWTAELQDRWFAATLQLLLLCPTQHLSSIARLNELSDGDGFVQTSFILSHLRDSVLTAPSSSSSHDTQQSQQLQQGEGGYGASPVPIAAPAPAATARFDPRRGLAALSGTPAAGGSSSSTSLALAAQQPPPLPPVDIPTALPTLKRCLRFLRSCMSLRPAKVGSSKARLAPRHPLSPIVIAYACQALCGELGPSYGLHGLPAMLAALSSQVNGSPTSPAAVASSDAPQPSLMLRAFDAKTMPLGPHPLDQTIDPALLLALSEALASSGARHLAMGVPSLSFSSRRVAELVATRLLFPDAPSPASFPSSFSSARGGGAVFLPLMLLSVPVIPSSPSYRHPTIASPAASDTASATATASVGDKRPYKQISAGGGDSASNDESGGDAKRAKTEDPSADADADAAEEHQHITTPLELLRWCYRAYQRLLLQNQSNQQQNQSNQLPPPLSCALAVHIESRELSYGDTSGKYHKIFNAVAAKRNANGRIAGSSATATEDGNGDEDEDGSNGAAAGGNELIDAGPEDKEHRNDRRYGGLSAELAVIHRRRIERIHLAADGCGTATIDVSEVAANYRAGGGRAYTLPSLSSQGFLFSNPQAVGPSVASEAVAEAAKEAGSPSASASDTPTVAILPPPLPNVHLCAATAALPDDELYFAESASPLGLLLAEPAIVKVMHCAGDAVPWLQGDFGLTVTNVWDSYTALDELFMATITAPVVSATSNASGSAGLPLSSPSAVSGALASGIASALNVATPSHASSASTALSSSFVTANSGRHSEASPPSSSLQVMPLRSVIEQSPVYAAPAVVCTSPFNTSSMTVHGGALTQPQLYSVEQGVITRSLLCEWEATTAAAIEGGKKHGKEAVDADDAASVSSKGTHTSTAASSSAQRSPASGGRTVTVKGGPDGAAMTVVVPASVSNAAEWLRGSVSLEQCLRRLAIDINGNGEGDGGSDVAQHLLKLGRAVFTALIPQPPPQRTSAHKTEAAVGAFEPSNPATLVASVLGSSSSGSDSAVEVALSATPQYALVRGQALLQASLRSQLSTLRSPAHDPHRGATLHFPLSGTSWYKRCPECGAEGRHFELDCPRTYTLSERIAVPVKDGRAIVGTASSVDDGSGGSGPATIDLSLILNAGQGVGFFEERSHRSSASSSAPHHHNEQDAGGYIW